MSHFRAVVTRRDNRDMASNCGYDPAYLLSALKKLVQGTWMEGLKWEAIAYMHSDRLTKAEIAVLIALDDKPAGT
jgi:hypothetical protein